MTQRQIVILKVAVWIACLLPLVRLVYHAITHDLTANPIEFITLSTGIWTLTFLMASLAITPLRRITGKNWLIRFRRLLGLFAFFYALLHFLIYLVLDQTFDLDSILHDIGKRPFITMGFTAFVLLIPLAVTSTAWSIRKLGGRRWNLLHRLVYVSGVAAVIHFWWKVKADTRQPAIYAVVLTVLLLARVFWNMKQQQQRALQNTVPSSKPVTD